MAVPGKDRLKSRFLYIDFIGRYKAVKDDSCPAHIKDLGIVNVDDTCGIGDML